MDLSGKHYKAFVERLEALKKQYSPKQAEKQHLKGKLTARERLNLLFDPGTFEELDAFVTPADHPIEFGRVERTYGDGVIVGHGKVNGRLVFGFAQDFTVMGGSLGYVCQKIAKFRNGAENGHTDHRYDGFRRSKDPGRSGTPQWLRRYLP
jgi:propionyl-CoA carboxylase beta chain